MRRYVQFSIPTLLILTALLLACGICVSPPVGVAIECVREAWGFIIGLQPQPP